MTFIDFVAIMMLLASVVVYIKVYNDGYNTSTIFMQGFMVASVVFTLFSLVDHIMP